MVTLQECVRIFCSVPASGMHEDVLQCPCRQNVWGFSAMSQRAEFMGTFCSVPAGGMHEDLLQCPCRRNAWGFFAVSLQAECMRLFCSVPTGGMPDDFLQCPCRRNACALKTTTMRTRDVFVASLCVKFDGGINRWVYSLCLFICLIWLVLCLWSYKFEIIWPYNPMIICLPYPL